MGQLIELPIRHVTPELVESATAERAALNTEKFHAYALPSPVSSRRLELEIPVGGSVADVIKAFGIPAGSEARVCVNDRVVAVDERAGVFPKVGDVVTIRVIPGSISASLAATLVAAGVSATTAAAAASVAVTVVVGAVTSLIGKLITMALAPPSAGGSPKVSASPKQFSVSGKQNVAAPFSPIPKFYGSRNAAPQYAATPYIELIGGDQYLRMLFLLGYGPVDISQLKIKDNPLEGYDDVEWELRAGFPDDAPPRLYPGSVVENDITVVLNTDHSAAVPTSAGEQIQTSGVNADELCAVVQFLSGFSATDTSNGNSVWIQMHLKIRWGPTGTTPGGAGWVNEPDIVLASHGKGHSRRGHTWRVPRGQYDVGLQVTHFAAGNGDWSKLIYQAVCTWTSLTTIRAQAPFAMAGLAMIAMRIRASRQLNGVVDALNCVAGSILPDYNATAPTDKWKDRAGAWFYDYDNPVGGGGGNPFDPAALFSIGGAFDGTSGGIYRTTDFAAGTGWTDVSVSSFDRSNDYYQDINQADDDHATMVAIGNRIDYSTDGGVTWHDTNINGGSYTNNLILGQGWQRSIAFSPTHVVVVGEYDAFGSGPKACAFWADRSNLSSWNGPIQLPSALTSPPFPFASSNQAAFGVAYGNGVFLAIGCGCILKASDSALNTWTAAFTDDSYGPLTTDENAHNYIAVWGAILFANGQFLILANGKNSANDQAWMMTTPDGGAFTVFNAGIGTLPAFDFYGIKLYWNGLLWVVNGNGADSPGTNPADSLFTSPDAATFTKRFDDFANSANYNGVIPVGTDFFLMGYQNASGLKPAFAKPSPANDPTATWSAANPASLPGSVFYTGPAWGKPGVGILLFVPFPASIYASTDDGATWSATSPPAGLIASAFAIMAFNSLGGTAQ